MPSGQVPVPVEGGSINVVDRFRRLYFHLYGNAGASRAERIAGDLCLLLLLKAAVDRHGVPEAVTSYLEGTIDDPTALIHTLDRHYPALMRERGGFSLSGSGLREAAADLLQVDLGNAPAHSIGDAFQALVGPRLRGERGQFFTPRTLVRAMVTMVDPHPGETVVDPACGTGGFLVEAHTHRAGQGGPGSLVGRDKDADMVGLATALLELVAPAVASVQRTNALDLHHWDGRGAPALGEVDAVLTNPPFGTRIGVRDPEVLGGYELGHTWQTAPTGWEPTQRLQDAQDPQILFLELCVRLLKPGGRLAIVLPEGVFGNHRQGYVWSWLRRLGSIEALLDCPRTTFQPGTDIKTNVLMFRRSGRSGRQHRHATKIAVAHHCGHDCRGRTHGVGDLPHRDDFADLAARFNAAKNDWSAVDLSDCSYFVPRYHLHEVAQSGPERDLVGAARWARLDELVSDGVLLVRKGHEVGARHYGTGEIPFIRTSDLANQEVRSDPTKAVSQEVYERHRVAQALAPETILLVADGRYRIGTTAILAHADLPCVVQSHLRIFQVAQTDVVDPYELLFALNLAQSKERLRRLVFVQSTLGTLGGRLMQLELPILHGDGPWREAVDRFRAILRQRRTLLAELAELAALSTREEKS